MNKQELKAACLHVDSDGGVASTLLPPVFLRFDDGVELHEQ